MNSQGDVWKSIQHSDTYQMKSRSKWQIVRYVINGIS